MAAPDRPGPPRVAIALLLVIVGLAGYALVTRLGAPEEASAPPPSVTPTTIAITPPIDAAVVRPRITRAPRTDPRPDILLFTIDTLRADHVTAYGYERDTMPTFTELASHGTRFERAYAASSWTVPSVASIVTGVLPSQHGVTHGFRVDEHDVVGQEVLSAELPTIAAQLHDAGYRTVGVTANVHLSQVLGFGRGFDSYTCLDFYTTVAEVRPVVARQLDALRASETPYFLWVHLVEPHAPYQPREPIFDQWWPAPRARYPQIDALMLEEFLDALFLREHIPVDEGMAYAVAAYDSEIRAADDYLHELLLALDDGHLAVLVTSDHGEEFHDHLRTGHGHTAFEEVVRVPLVLSLPDQHASVVPGPVSLVDVMPTLLDVAGVAAPSGIAGRSLLPALRGEALEARPLVIETGRGGEIVQAIVDGWFKYGRRIEPDPIQGLFDLEHDPHETHNLMAADPAHADALRARLEAIVLEARTRRPALTTATVDLSEELRDQLRALGYGQ